MVTVNLVQVVCGGPSADAVVTQAGWVKMDLKAGAGKGVILNPDTD